MTAVFIHVQHLLGIGHQRRMAAIARGLCTGGVTVTYATGGVPLPDLDTGSARVVQLPPVRVLDAAYDRYVDASGREIDSAWREARREMLLAEFSLARPDVLLLETFPFGRRMFRFELLPLLDLAKRADPPVEVAVSVRDIPEPRKKPHRETETLDWLEAYVDQVFVHGDPGIAPLDIGFPRAREIKAKLEYTGYVCTPAAPGRASAHGAILVSVGGGAVGEALLRSTARARRMTLHAGKTWCFFAGKSPNPAFRRELERLAGPEASVEPNRSDFVTLLNTASLSISQAGYNTVVEAAQAGCRQLLLPFGDHGEREQALRAQAFAKAGMVSYLLPEDCSPPSIAGAVDKALAMEPPPYSSISADGLRRTVNGILAMADDSPAEQAFP